MTERRTLYLKVEFYSDDKDKYNGFARAEIDEILLKHGYKVVSFDAKHEGV